MKLSKVKFFKSIWKNFKIFSRYFHNFFKVFPIFFSKILSTYHLEEGYAITSNECSTLRPCLHCQFLQSWTAFNESNKKTMLQKLVHTNSPRISLKNEENIVGFERIFIFEKKQKWTCCVHCKTIFTYDYSKVWTHSWILNWTGYQNDRYPKLKTAILVIAPKLSFLSFWL